MRGAGGEAKRGWRGSVSGSNGAEFGEERWSVAVGISEGKGGGFRSDFRRLGVKCWVDSLCGMGGCVVRSLGEIRGPIPSDFGGVPGAGSLWKEEAEVGCFWVDFRGRTGLSLARDCTLECLSSLPGSTLPFSPLVFGS